MAISGGLEGGIIEAQRAILEPSTPWRVVLQVRTVCACRRLTCVGICPVLTPQLQSFPQEATASGYPPEILLGPKASTNTPHRFCLCDLRSKATDKKLQGGLTYLPPP